MNRLTSWCLLLGNLSLSHYLPSVNLHSKYSNCRRTSRCPKCPTYRCMCHLRLLSSPTTCISLLERTNLPGKWVLSSLSFLHQQVCCINPYNIPDNDTVTPGVLWAPHSAKYHRVQTLCFSVLKSLRHTKHHWLSVLGHIYI